MDPGSKIDMVKNVRIILTGGTIDEAHDTGTTGETARYMSNRMADETVVLTGAICPFSLLPSDSEFGFNCAMIGAQVLEPGVWRMTNARVLQPLT